MAEFSPMGDAEDVWVLLPACYFRNFSSGVLFREPGFFGPGKRAMVTGEVFRNRWKQEYQQQ
jgi:hypothetical protein